MTGLARPVGPRLLVKPDEPTEEIRYSGIVLPPDVQRRQRGGIVIAAGSFLAGWDSFDSRPLPVEEGDHVIYRDGSGLSVAIVNEHTGATEDFLVLDIEDVLLVLLDAPVMR